MITGIVAVLCCIIVLVWAWRILVWVWIRPKRLEKCLRQQGLKGNSYKLLFGDMKEMSKMRKQAMSTPITPSHDIILRVMPFVYQSITKYGKNSFIWFGPTPRVYIMDPELIRDVLNKYSIFQRPKSNPLVRLLAYGLASIEGEKWATHRKIINPAFHAEKLKHMLPAFYLSCGEIMCKWEEMASTNRTFEVDVWPYLETLTSDAISRTSFGSSYEEGRKIFQLQKEQARLAIQALLSVYIPGSRYWPSKRNNRMMKIDKEVKFLLKNIIDNKMKSLVAGETNSDDLLGILLESNLKEIKRTKCKNFGMSTNDVIEECKLFYFAGQETTSVLLVWTLILLSMHPNWQTHAREEVMQAFQNEMPDIEGLNRLKIVNMILYEVLRLYPPVILLNRSIHKEIKLGEMILPKGVQVSVPIMLIHRDNDLWGDDANEFKPERFSEGVSKATKNQLSFFPFSGGPRICVGQSFAMLETKISLSMILQRFSFELSPSYTHAPLPVITLQPQYGAHLILHKI